MDKSFFLCQLMNDPNINEREKVKELDAEHNQTNIFSTLVTILQTVVCIKKLPKPPFTDQLPHGQWADHRCPAVGPFRRLRHLGLQRIVCQAGPVFNCDRLD